MIFIYSLIKNIMDSIMDLDKNISPTAIRTKSILIIALLFFMNNITTIAQTETQQSNLDFVPQWAKEVVWYQIFPERFCLSVSYTHLSPIKSFGRSTS